MPASTIIPAGSFAAPAAGLRTMLAHCPTWQAGVHATTPEEASQRVFFKDAVGTERRPLAVISPGQGHEYRQIAGGAQNWLRPSGSLFLYLARDSEPPYVDDNLEAEFAAANFFGQVIDDLAERSGADFGDTQLTHLCITRMALLDFGETPEDHWHSLGRFWFAAYSIEWGDGGEG